jgi:hypothetical protein
MLANAIARLESISTARTAILHSLLPNLACSGASARLARTVEFVEVVFTASDGSTAVLGGYALGGVILEAHGLIDAGCEACSREQCEDKVGELHCCYYCDLTCKGFGLIWI